MTRRKSEPLVTVVVPTYRRPEALARCLDALAGQRLTAGAYEVVVVDDGSPEPLDGAFARRWQGLDLSVHRQPRGGPGAARNSGAKLARGRVLAFTDDDCVPDPGWLAALVAASERSPTAMIGGLTVNVLADNAYAEASQSLLGYLYATGQRRSGELPFIASNNVALVRSDFDLVGGFDASFPDAAAEDRDLSDRWRALGRPLVYEPAALVGHAHRMGLHAFTRQHVQYGRGTRLLQEARSRRDQPPLRVQAPHFYVAMLVEPFGRLPAARATRVAALVALSQASTAVGFLTESLRRRRSAG